MMTRRTLASFACIATWFASASAFVQPANQVDVNRVPTRLLSSDLPESDGDGLSRRQFAELSFAATGLGISFLGTRELSPTDYGLWGILPVGTYKQKQTLQKEIVPGKI